jgi:hypothetical protein
MLNQLFHITPVQADETLTQNLSMRIGEHHCSFAITGKGGADLYSLAYYSADEMNAEGLAEIFSRHPELRNSFEDVLLGYDHPQSVLVPQLFNQPDNAKNILKAMFGNIGGSSVVAEQLGEWQLANVRDTRYAGLGPARF